MARAETIERVGETGGGGNGPRLCHSTCRMELPGSFHTWPSLPTITSGITGGILLHHNRHNLNPRLAIYPSYPLPYPHPEGQDKLQTHQQFFVVLPSPTPPSPPPCNQGDERGGGRVQPSALSGEHPADSDREEHQEASSRQGPLPDLLPQSEHPSWASQYHRAPGGEGAQQLEVRRVAYQLRTVGDELNTFVLRAHAAPLWQDWRDACRGLLTFITQTLSTLYRLV